VSDITDPGASFDAAKFRQVLGHFPTGVTVITAVHEGQPVGMAVGSFSSLSLAPPQVLFCAGEQSSTWPKIREAGRFCVNILHEDQEDVCRVFAGKSADKFQGVGWRHSANGSPLLDGALAHIDCEIAQVVHSGDHDICIGAVQDLDVDNDGGPLLFYRGGYGHYEP
jgi:flavin reductase (DIM6/NTAB) family NADH-FMN oxidoreductase RutF